MILCWLSYLPETAAKACRGKIYYHWRATINRLVDRNDDKEIADVAKIYNCEVPFMRPEELAIDEMPSFDVIAHAVEFFKQNGSKFDYFILRNPLHTCGMRWI